MVDYQSMSRTELKRRSKSPPDSIRAKDELDRRHKERMLIVKYVAAMAAVVALLVAIMEFVRN